VRYDGEVDALRGVSLNSTAGRRSPRWARRGRASRPWPCAWPACCSRRWPAAASASTAWTCWGPRLSGCGRCVGRGWRWPCRGPRSTRSSPWGPRWPSPCASAWAWGPPRPAGGRRPPPRRSSSIRSSSSASPTSCQGASAAGRSWRWRSSSTPTCWCSTSPPPVSTPSPAWSWWSASASWPTGARSPCWSSLTEVGASRLVLDEPAHPYTAGLVAAFPAMTTTKDLRPVRGQPARPAPPPPGLPLPRPLHAGGGPVPARQPAAGAFAGADWSPATSVA